MKILIVLFLLFNSFSEDFFRNDNNRYNRMLMVVDQALLFNYTDEKIDSRNDSIIFKDHFLKDTIMELKIDSNFSFEKSEKNSFHIELYSYIEIRDSIPDHYRIDTLIFNNFDYYYLNNNQMKFDTNLFNMVLKWLPIDCNVRINQWKAMKFHRFKIKK